MFLRKFEYLDEKWLKCNLNGALKDPYFTRSAIFNTLIQDNELSDTKFHSIANAIGRKSYLRNDGKYYCGGKLLNCSCCDGICGPTSSCVCDSCQFVPASLELSEVYQNHQEKVNENSSEFCFESWMWGPAPDDNQLNTCIKKLLSEQRKICLQASDNSLSSFSLKMILKIYERYFTALARGKSKKQTTNNRESLLIDDDKNIKRDEVLNETRLTKSEKAKLELAKIGSRTALNFFFASLKRAWRSGDTELCSELLSDSLEAIQLSLDPGALFDTSSLSTLWLEAIEKSIKFLKQIVINDISAENESASSQHQIPKADRNISLNLLLELELQKGSLSGSLEGVLLLLTISDINRRNNDNRQSPTSSNGIPLVKILQRYGEINKDLASLITMNDPQSLSPTESFLRFLSLPEDDDDDEPLIDPQQAAVIIMSHLDRICRSHLPNKLWTSRIQNYRNQQIISLGYNGLSPEFNVFSSESDDKWMCDYTKVSNYSAPTIDFGANIIVEQITCAENAILLLSTNGEVFELQSDQTKAKKVEGFEQGTTILKISSHCEGKHFIAITTNGEIYSWGNGGYGQLGISEECLSKEIPTKIPVFNEKQVIDASCGTTYSAVITNNGELYTFGQGRFGKLGHGNSDDKPIPTLISALKSHRVIDVTCSDSHTLCVTDQGKVFAFGDQDFGKLGIGTTNGSSVPILIEGLNNIGSVYSGPHFSMAMSLDRQSIFTWGKGGRLGHDDVDEDLYTPKKIDGLNGKVVEKVSVGSAHCLLLMSNGELYGFGKNDFQQVCPPCISKDQIIAKPILTTPPFLKISGIACGSTQSIIWSHSSMICIPPKIPFVIDLCEQTFRLLDQLLSHVCGPTGSSTTTSNDDHPPNQEAECIAVASLNLMCLQFHAMICNNISPKKVGLTGVRLKNVKSRILQLSGGSSVLKTIQEAAQSALQVGWSILLPTPSERAQTLTSLLPDPSQASAHRFMTDLLVGSIMAEGGLETALNQIINSESQDGEQLPLLDLLKQLLHNNSTLTQSRLNQLLIENLTKVNDDNLNETSSPSVDLLHKFQRLLLSHIISANHEDLSGAESLFEAYIVLMASLCVSTLTKAQDVILQNKEDVALILQSDISDSLLYELLLGLILVQKERPTFLSSLKWMETFLPLLTSLDNLNRLMYETDVKNSDDMGWPGIICRDGDNDRLNVVSDTQLITKNDFENHILDGCQWVVINGLIYDVKDFQSTNLETHGILINGIGKDLTAELNVLEHQKTLDEITNLNSILIGKLECETLPKLKHVNQSYEKLSYFESEKTLAWILGMRSNILERSSPLQPAETTCKKMLNSIILRGGLQTIITNPFDEEKFEARSSGSTAGSTPTTDGVHLLGETVHFPQFPPLQYRIQSFIFGLAEGRTSESSVCSWISLSERYCKENNLIWHQEYSTDHPIIDVERLLTAVLIRHQSLGTLVLALIDRDMSGLNGKVPQSIAEIIKIVHMMKWNLIKIRQQLNRSYKEVCTPILEKCRFLLYEVRPTISPEQTGLKKLFQYYKEPRFKSVIRKIIENSREVMIKDNDSEKIEDLLNASIQSTHNSMSKVAQFVSEHFERHLSTESLQEANESIQTPPKTASSENLLGAETPVEESNIEEASESDSKPLNANDDLVNNLILKLIDRYNQNEDAKFKSNVNNQIVDFVMTENFDVETLRRAMFCQIQRYQTRKEGLQMFDELLSIDNLLDAAKYNIYNGYLNSAYGDENPESYSHQYDHILENLNLVTAYQKADILIAHSKILEWTIKEFQKYVNQENFLGKHKWSHGDKDQTNLGTYVFLKKVSRARFLLMIFGLLSKNYSGNELSLLINSGLLGTSLGLLHQTGSHEIPTNNKSDKELSVIYEEDIKSRHLVSKDGLLSGPDLVKQMKIGTRVARGADWKWGDQDGNGEGRIISEVGDDGWVRVEWDTGATNSYRMGKEGQYDLRLADSSFKAISPDKDSDKENEMLESKLQQNESHPTKLLKSACIKLLQMISTTVGVHGDKMQSDAIRVFVTMFFSILNQKNNSSSIGLDIWRSIAFLRGILRSHNVSKHVTTELWMRLYFEILQSPTNGEKDVYKKVQCIRLLQTTLVQWNDEESQRIEFVVEKLFLLLGNVCMNCPNDYSLTQLPIGVKSRVLASASHSGTIAEELISLLRKLHTLSVWNDAINSFISQKMCIAADIFLDSDRDNNVNDEKLNVVAALNLIGGFDPRPRVGVDLVYDSVKCSIFRMTRTGSVILNVHGSNEMKNVAFSKIEKLVEQGIFSLSKLSLNEIVLNSFAVLMYGMNDDKSKSELKTFDIAQLDYQQIQLSSLKATQVLFRHQSLLKTILRQRSPGIIKYPSNESFNPDETKTSPKRENEDKKSPVNELQPQPPKQELLVQSILSRAIQSSPLKACYNQHEMETAALAICQTLSAHYKNNIPVSQVKFQHAKQATMVHGNSIYNSMNESSNNFVVAGSSEASRANPATKLVIQIMEMGFSRKTVELALKQITNRVEILPTADQVVQWVIDHPESIVDEDSKGTLNKINSFNISSAAESDHESSCSENLSSLSSSQQDRSAKFARRDDIRNADQYAVYVRNHICPGMLVRCCRDFEEIRAGDVGIVLKVEPDELHDLNVRVDFKTHERPFWMCFVHLEMLEYPSDDIKSSNITYGSHVKIKPSSTIARTQVVKNVVGVVTAINGLEVIVDFPTQKSWCGQLGDLELVHPASTENDVYDIIEDWSQCLKSLTVSSNEASAKFLLERSANYWQSSNSQGRPWIRLEMRENVLIHALSIRIDPNDCSHQPCTIILRTGDSLSSLKDFNWVTVKSNDTHVVLLSNVRQYFNWVEIYIKQCRNNGIQCRIHDLYMIGKRKQTDLDAMLTNASFLASDCDLNDQSYATTTNSYKDEKVVTRNTLGKDDGSGRVYVWGLNDKEQLAGLKGSKVKIPTFSTILSALKPIHIAGGSKSLFIVSQEGKLYACGESTWGRLGLGITHNNNISTPQELPVINQYIVKKVAVHSGGKHALAITLDGKIFSWGEGEDGKLGHGNRLTLDKPKMIEVLKTKRIRDIACGSAHSAAITSQGELYTWGLGEFGRLGHGDISTLLKPKLVAKLVGQRVVQVACGSRDAQTLCLTEDGTVYSWGDGDFGKLGRGGSEGCLVPNPIERLNGLDIIQIECGAQFSLALTKSGEVWTWGKGDYYRLGHGTDQHVRKPTPIQCLRGKKIVHVAVGALHCLAVSDSGQVYAWGDNDHGQQGTNNTSVNKKPTLVCGLDGIFVNRVACGSSHSIAWSLPESESEFDKKEAVPFTVPKDPLGGHSLGMYSSDDQTTSSPASHSKVKQPRKSLSEVVLSMESTTALQAALVHILNAIKILQARSCIIAALTSHAQVKNHQSSFDTDKIFKSEKSEDIVEQDKQEVIAQTSQRDIASSQIASGGGESLADDCEIPVEGGEIMINDPEYPTNPLSATSNSLYRSLTNSMSLSMSSCNNAAQKHSKMSTSAMSVMACIINHQEEMINEVVNSKPGLDEFLDLFSDTEARNLMDLLKLSVCGRISGPQTNAETIANTLIELGLNLSSIGNMIMETCINELEDLTSRHCLEKTPKPVVQESSHPYVDDITLVGHVKINGAEFLRIEFDPQCSTEKRNDPIILMDASGRVVATRSGREYANWAQEIRIPGDEMRWKFTSDNSVNGWGFRFLVHAIMPASYLQELGSDRKILSQPSIDLVMVLLDSKLTPHNPNVLLRLVSALSQCAQKGTLSINQRIWCLKKIHSYLTTSKFASHASDASLLEIIQPLIPMILKQYEYEEGQVRTGVHLMHSEYFQCMIALACDLNVDNIIPSNDAHKWLWFKRYCAAVRVAKSLIRRSPLPKTFCMDVRKKIEATSGSVSVNTITNEMNTSIHSQSSYQHSPSLQTSTPNDHELIEFVEAHSHEDHSVFTPNHDSQLLQWFNRRPEDWAFSWGGGASTIYGWGHNHRGQLGGLDGSRIKIPTPCEALSMLRPVQIVGGEQTLYAVTHDGKVYATGYNAGGRLGVGGIDSVAVPTLIESLQHVFIKKVAVNSGGKHCLALSSDHEVFSWGEGEDGKLGHGNRDSYDRPKLIESLSELGVIDIACGSAHSAAITSEGHVLTWGKGRYGRLGHGDSEDQLKPKVVEALLGYRAVDIACGSGDAQTLCITDDDNVWSWGDGDYGKLGRGGSDGCKVPMKIESLAGLGVIKVECGSQFSVALTRSGSVYTWGKGDYHRLGHGNSEHVRRPKKVAALQGKKIVSIATGSLHCIACTDSGEVFTWGDNDEGQLGDGTVTAIQRPRLVNALQGKHIVQVVCGSAHTLAISTCPHSISARTLPSAPMEYDLVRDLESEILQNRLVLLHHFSELICPCLAMLPIEGDLSLGALRDILVYTIKEASLRKVIQCTMVRDKPHGPTIELNRIQVKRSRNRTHNGLAGIDGMKSVFGQMVQKLPLLNQESLFLPHRVWKVKFVGESVDDCGGGFSESIAEMCDELQNGSVPLLIQTPNGRGEAGANRDCFLLDPTLVSVLHMNMFRFLGVLIGIAVRTGSPLSLNCLAEPVWRQLVGQTLRPSDLTEVDRDYVTGLLCIRDMEDDQKIFQSMELPFSTPSAKGHEVFLSTKYTHITPDNRQEYVKLALNYRLHEFDEQIKAVRDGMSKVIPVPLLSLFSASELQEMVCGSPDIPLGLLKTVATYKGIDSTSPLIQWFWEVMEEFTNQERSLFLRFVWGRTRLPRNIADFRGRDFVLQVLDKYNPPDHFLPESYTCFFLLKMPRYSCKAVLQEKLKYAIHFCKSIDTDDYARVNLGDPTSHTASEDNSDIESIA